MLKGVCLLIPGQISYQTDDCQLIVRALLENQEFLRRTDIKKILKSIGDINQSAALVIVEVGSKQYWQPAHITDWQDPAKVILANLNAQLLREWGTTPTYSELNNKITSRPIYQKLIASDIMPLRLSKNGSIQQLP